MNHETIERIALSKLLPWTNNARTHSKKQIKQIAESIELFGWTNPVLIDEQNNILAGHGRVMAAKKLALDTIPCLRLDHMSEAQKRAYVLADNKLALNAGWDDELLALELGELIAEDLDFDLGVIGFSVPEIDAIIATASPEESGDPADDILPDENITPRVKLGDIWELGNHRLICGNSLDPSVISELMDMSLARMIFADPPYNVPINGHVGGSGKTQHREFAMASGEMSQSEFTEFLTKSFQNMARHSQDGSIHFICMDWRHMPEILKAGHTVYSELKNLITWVKDNGGMGTFYRSRHELIFAFKQGTAPHLNNFELGQHGRYRTNVWEYRGVNTLKAGLTRQAEKPICVK